MLTGLAAERKTKGEHTRAVILEAALSLAGREGLEGLSTSSTLPCGALPYSVQ